MVKKVFSWLSKKERALFDRLNTPQKIQDFLNSLPQNFEQDGETCMSQLRVLRENTAHCIEGAFFAAAVLWYHGKRPLIMHLTTSHQDQDHVVTIFRDGDRYGALSKTNHAVLRYRDAVYSSPRELAMSYFNEYFKDKTGRKTLVGYTLPIDLEKEADSEWLSSEEGLWYLNDLLYHYKHNPIAPRRLMKKLRPADRIERKVMDVPEQRPSKRRN